MARDDTAPHLGVSQREFIALVAAMMAIGALGVDMMLPALPRIGAGLGVTNANAVQYIIAAYSFGFGAGQLIHGPLADRYGRKPVLVVALLGFVAMSFVAAASASLTLLIAARAVQGMFGAATRVLVVSVVRDCYQGRTMARIMSLASMLFFIVPILAPSLGAVLLLIGSWRWNFWVLGILAAAILAWTATRLPETLHPGDRREISVASLTAAYRIILTNRFSLGYAIGQALSFGGLMGYILSSEQIVAGTFGRPGAFPVVFAVIALAMGCSVFANSRLVERFGTRKLSHGAMLAAIAIALLHISIIIFGHETLTTFVALQALQMTTFGLIGANFSAMAMEPVGHIAGTASSVQGFIGNAGGAAIGALIGQAYDGTTLPLAIGLALGASAALAVVLIVERGRLFVPHHADPRPKG
ncbi:MAG TPA: multidrug effflux MFS transporter [Sphingomonas sp.]|jgi:DHA1 family bicyclomycin/chloramphenicol resistance-like MFS transporter|nr:multidrug effflux MFS transporter [Sphingomonas sp.]